MYSLQIYYKWDLDNVTSLHTFLQLLVLNSSCKTVFPLPRNFTQNDVKISHHILINDLTSNYRGKRFGMSKSPMWQNNLCITYLCITYFSFIKISTSVYFTSKKEILYLSSAL